MSLVEALEGRRLFSQFGLDPSFGTGGIIDVSAKRDDADLVTRRSVSAILDTGTAVYVAVATDGNAQSGDLKPGYVARYTETGAVDTAWGNGGVAELPFTATKLAYDRRTGTLYAAGDRDTDRNGPDADVVIKVLNVARFTAAGVPDAAYGTAGVVEYDPATPVGEIVGTATPTHLLVRPHGGLDVGLSVTDVAEGDGVTYDYRVAVGVLRLKNNGRRDVAFGHRGVVALSKKYDHYTLPILTPTPDGGFDAVITDAALPDVRVQRLGISAAGKVTAGPPMRGPKTVVSDTDANYRAGPASVVADADHVYATDVHGRSLYTLTPGRPTVSRPLKVPGLSRGTGSYDGITLVSAPRGGFYALNNFDADTPYQGVAVARLRLDFSPDRRFGTNGLIATGAYYSSQIFPDTSGRFLAITQGFFAPPTVTRLLGRGADGPATSVHSGDSRTAGDVIRVAGTAGDDTVDVRYDAPTGTIIVAVNGKPAKTYRARFYPSLVIDTGRGDDTITIDGVQAKTIVLAGGGDDTMRVTNCSGTIGRDCGFALRGGGGRDTFGVTGSSDVQINGGNDDDRLTIDAYLSDSYSSVIESIESRESV